MIGAQTRSRPGPFQCTVQVGPSELPRPPFSEPQQKCSETRVLWLLHQPRALWKSGQAGKGRHAAWRRPSPGHLQTGPLQLPEGPGVGSWRLFCPLQVSRLVHAIKMGWIKPRRPREDTGVFYDLWAQEDHNSILGRHKMHVPAPKLPLPGHQESYNPPPEYLLTEEEVSRAGPASPPLPSLVLGQGRSRSAPQGGLSWPALTLTLTLQPGRGLCALPRGGGRRGRGAALPKVSSQGRGFAPPSSLSPTTLCRNSPGSSRSPRSAS